MPRLRAARVSHLLLLTACWLLTSLLTATADGKPNIVLIPVNQNAKPLLDQFCLAV